MSHSHGRTAKQLLALTIIAFSTSAAAEYYVVYSAPTVVVENPAPPCRVYRPCKVYKPCRVYKKIHHKRPCYRRYTPPCARPCMTQRECNAANRPCYRPGCSSFSIYYGIPNGMPCGSGGGNMVWIPSANVIQPPGMTVVYGPPIYRPNTYHPVEEFNDPNLDMRTGDDVYFY